MKKKNDFEMRELVDRFMRMPAYKDKIYKAKIHQFWKEKMGSTIGKSVHSIRVHRGKLFIGLESSVIRQELEMSKETILVKMNEVIGEDYIKDVVFR